jgi:hypothetical protein
MKKYEIKLAEITRRYEDRTGKQKPVKEESVEEELVKEEPVKEEPPRRFKRGRILSDLNNFYRIR